jgi:hypothetical protein
MMAHLASEAFMTWNSRVMHQRPTENLMLGEVEGSRGVGRRRRKGIVTTA